MPLFRMGDPLGPRIARPPKRAHHAPVTLSRGEQHERLVRGTPASGEQRERLVREMEASAGVHEPRILAAFRAVPREAFVPADLAEHAYEDRALPIGAGQTISQPSMIALMLMALAPAATDRALEVGSGSGYAAALLGRLVHSVLGLEIVPELCERARATLAEVGATNVAIELGNGPLAAHGRGPFDVILVSAAAHQVPSELLTELAPGGRIAIPVGDASGQHLYAGRRGADGTVAWERQTPCVFVPLVNPD
jgi:protein-L-isoaspartate(D-aspartate) O-methyltransferase